MAAAGDAAFGENSREVPFFNDSANLSQTLDSLASGTLRNWNRAEEIQAEARHRIFVESIEDKKPHHALRHRTEQETIGQSYVIGNHNSGAIGTVVLRPVNFEAVQGSERQVCCKP